MAESTSLVQKLFDGPVDIVGDIHGECGALQVLLYRLGYDSLGKHPENRRLVFVGDLVDRGPDSPGTVKLVRELVESGTAQMVLGNHELNLLRGSRKHGNHWFFGKSEQLCKLMPQATHAVLRPEAPSFQVLLQNREDADSMLEFLRRQPLALERDDLRVVHAMWDSGSVDALRKFHGNAVEAFDKYQQDISRRLAEKHAQGEVVSEDDAEMAIQNENPVAVLTSGMELPAEAPFFAGGKWRTLERHRWWQKSEESTILTVVGHYWRRLPDRVDLGFDVTGPPLFDATESPSLLGPYGKVMCVDYSAGLRYEERGRGLAEGSLGTGLAALRWPEMTLHFADGRPPISLQQQQQQQQEQ